MLHKCNQSHKMSKAETRFWLSCKTCLWKNNHAFRLISTLFNNLVKWILQCTTGGQHVWHHPTQPAVDHRVCLAVATAHHYGDCRHPLQQVKGHPWPKIHASCVRLFLKVLSFLVRNKLVYLALWSITLFGMGQNMLFGVPHSHCRTGIHSIRSTAFSSERFLGSHFLSTY